MYICVLEVACLKRAPVTGCGEKKMKTKEIPYTGMVLQEKKKRRKNKRKRKEVALVVDVCKIPHQTLTKADLEV